MPTRNANPSPLVLPPLIHLCLAVRLDWCWSRGYGWTSSISAPMIWVQAGNPTCRFLTCTVEGLLHHCGSSGRHAVTREAKLHHTAEPYPLSGSTHILFFILTFFFIGELLQLLRTHRPEVTCLLLLTWTSRWGVRFSLWWCQRSSHWSPGSDWPVPGSGRGSEESSCQTGSGESAWNSASPVGANTGETIRSNKQVTA